MHFALSVTTPQTRACSYEPFHVSALNPAVRTAAITSSSSTARAAAAPAPATPAAPPLTSSFVVAFKKRVFVLTVEPATLCSSPATPAAPPLTLSCVVFTVTVELATRCL